MKNSIFKLILTTLLITLFASPLVCLASLSENDKIAVKLGDKVSGLLGNQQNAEQLRKDSDYEKALNALDNIYDENTPLTPDKKATLQAIAQKHPNMSAQINDIIKMKEELQKMVDSQKQKK